MIWTHHMKNITYHEDFTPLGAPSDEVLHNSQLQHD